MCPHTQLRESCQGWLSLSVGLCSRSCPGEKPKSQQRIPDIPWQAHQGTTRIPNFWDACMQARSVTGNARATPREFSCDNAEELPTSELVAHLGPCLSFLFPTILQTGPIQLRHKLGDLMLEVICSVSSQLPQKQPRETKSPPLPA